jgi:hypothetical protein
VILGMKIMDVANVRYGRYVRFGGHSGMAFWDYC